MAQEGGSKEEDEEGTDSGLPGGQAVKLSEPDFQAIRTETHKYVEYGDGDRELYDLETDPYELENVYESADLSLLEDLKAKLDALKSCSKQGCREAEDAL